MLSRVLELTQHFVFHFHKLLSDIHPYGKSLEGKVIIVCPSAPLAFQLVSGAGAAECLAYTGCQSQNTLPYYINEPGELCGLAFAAGVHFLSLSSSLQPTAPGIPLLFAAFPKLKQKIVSEPRDGSF